MGISSLKAAQIKICILDRVVKKLKLTYNALHCKFPTPAGDLFDELLLLQLMYA